MYLNGINSNLFPPLTISSLTDAYTVACHVAVQRNHPSKHRLWKHALSRQNAKGQGPMPDLQIVYIIS